MFPENELRDINHIQFGILTPEEVIKQSVCEINVSKLNSINSVYDDKMGTMDNIKKCATCGLLNKDCIGHFGHIVLNVNILHPLFHKVILNILKCICYKCSRVLLSKEQLELNGLLKYSKQTRFHKIMSKMDRVDFCSLCETVQPRYVFSNSDRFIYMIFKMDGENSRIQMMENEIRKIFEQMVPDDIALLGFDPLHFHPRSLILSVLPVIPPVARPFIIADNITCDDDLTIQYMEIVKANQHILDNTMPDVKLQKHIQSLKFRIKSLFDNSGDRQKLSNGRPLKSIKKRLTGKEGLIRNNLMGKRVDKSARTVIGPDPTLRVDEIAIPKEIADILCYPVRVTDKNMDYLKNLIHDGGANFLLRDQGNTRINLRYAGMRQGTKLFFGDVIRKAKNSDIVIVKHERDLFCLEDGDIIYRDGKRLMDTIPNIRRPVDIKVGDIVERKLKNGDILLLNRQPTLHKGSMIAQKVIIRPGKTIRMNLAITKSFNADFDGDEMNLHAPASPETEAELRFLSGVKENLISCQSSKANIVIVQDALLGAYLMTLSDRPLLSKALFFQIMMALPCHDNMDRKVVAYHRRFGEIYTGRLLFSMLLPDDFSFEGTNSADPNEPKVIIEKGILVAGAINKSNLSSGHSSFITIFFHEYGKEECINFVNNVQFLAIKYILHFGFSIGMGDCIITKQDEINNAVSRSFLKAKSNEVQTQEEQLKEIYVSYALSGARDTGMNIAQKALKKNNNFLRTVVSGAKGDYFNIAQITGLLGQQNLNGQRICPQLSNNTRTLPHYPIKVEDYTDDMRYESRGFIKSSFTKGLSPREFYFHTMTGREGITDTAMKTATSGYIQRRMIKLAEDIQIKYDNTVRNSSGGIIQFIYGDNNMDPVHTVFNKSENGIACNVERLVQRLNNRAEDRLNASVS